jgi:iron complex transport system ATP-binding protein
MTNENVAQDQPCNFISKGDFNTLFKDEHIAFDSEKGKFVVQ